MPDLTPKNRTAANPEVDRRLMSVVVPTYQREDVLVATLRAVAASRKIGIEVLVVDQTREHQRATADFLRSGEAAGWLRWFRLDRPSIPRAMNVGLREARGKVVLYLDDDVDPADGLIEAHERAHRDCAGAWAVVGQVLQPGEASARRNGWRRRGGFDADLDFPFWSDERAWVSNVMAGNLSVKRERALAVGGFDECFEGAAYRFETEFSRRLMRAGGKILFEPAASVRHLRVERGGTRSDGSHLTSASGRHGMGDYYFALRSGLSRETLGYMLRRPYREVSTKFHLRHPWYIPVKLLGELRAFGAAVRAVCRGTRLLESAGMHRTETLEREPRKPSGCGCAGTAS